MVKNLKRHAGTQVSKRMLLRCFLPVVLAILGLTACDFQAKEDMITFQTIEIKDLSEMEILYQAEQPEIVVITRAEEAQRLAGVITNKALQTLIDLDYKRYFALAAFSGLRETTGYGIQINGISKKGNIISIHAQLFLHAEDPEAPYVLTSPYHLVTVQKNAAWEQEILFALFANHTFYDSISIQMP